MDNYFDFSEIINSLEDVFNADHIRLKIKLSIKIRGNNALKHHTLRFNLNGVNTSLRDARRMEMPINKLLLVKTLIYPFFLEGEDSLSFGYIKQAFEIVDETDDPFIIVDNQIEKVYVTEIFQL